MFASKGGHFVTVITLLQHSANTAFRNRVSQIHEHRLLQLINPRRVCAARVTVLGLCVCLSVCVSVYDYSRTTGYEAAYERYQQLQCYKGICSPGSHKMKASDRNIRVVPATAVEILLTLAQYISSTPCYVSKLQLLFFWLDRTE